MRWIPINGTDVLPDEGEDVIIKNKGAKITLAATFQRGKFNRYAHYHDNDRCILFSYDPTHWMPMPGLNFPRSR